MKRELPAWLILTIICVVAAALLAGTNLLTKDTIAANALREKYATLTALMPDAADFEETESGVMIGKDDAGNPVGYSLAATTQGFGGEVETTVAAKPDGVIAGISVGGSNFAETAGLGARAKEPEFQNQFAGKNAPVALTKDGGEIEALSGATITSRAVIKGVNEAMEGISSVAGFTVEGAGAIASEHLGENLYAASGTGFGGPVKVYLTLDENRAIQEISIGDSQFAETKELGGKAQEAAFQDQFIGKTIPLTMSDIDAISGATITTNAVLEAISTIHEDLENGLADTPITEEKAAPAPAATASPQASSGVRRRASSSSSTTETATDTAAQTSTGTGSAVRRRSAGSGSAAATAAPTETAKTGGSAVRRRSSSSSAGTAGTTAAAPAAQLPDAADYAYNAAAQGYGGPVRVYLSLDEDGAITAIAIGDSEFNESDGLGALAKEEAFQSQFIGKKIPVAQDDIDAITYATITTTAVIEAIQQIADQVK